MKEGIKVQILWLAICAPIEKANHAGQNTFQLYCRHLLKDKDFDVKVVANLRKEDISGIDDLILAGDPVFLPKETKLVKRIADIESRFNPLNRNCCMISNSDSQMFTQALQKLSESGYSPDIVILDWTQTLMLIDTVRTLFPHSQLVSDEPDVTFIGIERRREYYSGIKGIFESLRYKNVKAREVSALAKCDLIYVQNRDNKGALVQEGIRHERINWLVPNYNNMSDLVRNPDKSSILFFGAMNRLENALSVLWFIDNVMPLLDGYNVQLIVLGGGWHKSLEAVKNREDVVFTGYVENVQNYFSTSMCFVAPLVLGAGIKVKIIEAMSAAIPVLTNEIGIEGIPAEDRKEYIYCKKPIDYAKAIFWIMHNQNLAEQIGDNARELIRGEFNVHDSLDSFKCKIRGLKA